MAPSISSASGGSSTNSTITIAGTGFGTKTRSTPYFFFDGQAGTLTPSSTLSFSTSFDSTQNRSISADATNKRWGTYVTKAAWPRDGTSGGRSAVLQANISGLGYGSKLFIAGWRKWTSGDSTGNWKTWRIYPSSGNYPNAYIGNSDISNVNNWAWFLENGTPVTGDNRKFITSPKPTSSWQLEEIVMLYNSAAGVTDGSLDVRVNNASLGSDSSFAFDFSGIPGPIQRVDFQDTKANTDPDTAMNSYVTDFYVDDSWNRVYIGDNATFASCTHVELQPYSAWSATSITISARLGSFSSVSGCYLFVLDNSGVASSGYDISAIGGVAAPTVTAISPSAGALAGVTAVTITGTGFSSSLNGITIGGTACTSVVRVSATSATAVTPAKSAGSYDVVVTNSDTQTGTLSSGYTYQAAPTVTNCNPSVGILAGGDNVTLTGTGFTSSVSGVTFGGVSATSVVRVSATSITCTTPAKAAGTYNIVVTNSDTQTGTLSNGFTYQATAAPVVSSLSPSSGTTLGGTPVTITGTGFSTVINDVTFAGTSASSIVRVSNTSITCVTPAHAAGAVSVVVTNSDAQTGTLASGYTYAVTTPTVTSCSPSAGAVAGGTPITITGAGFTTTLTGITIGGTACTSVVRVSATSATAVTPAKAAGTYNIVVTNNDTQTGTLVGGYTYQAGPSVTSCSPDSGSDLGGDLVTVTGTGFTSTISSVTFGGMSATMVTYISATMLTCLSPAHDAGAVNVIVTNSDSQTGTGTGVYTYSSLSGRRRSLASARIVIRI